MSPKKPKRRPLTVVEESSHTITSDRLTTTIDLHFRGSRIHVVGRRRSVDGDEVFFRSGSVTTAASLWTALRKAASEGCVDLPSMTRVVADLKYADRSWARALAAFSEE